LGIEQNGFGPTLPRPKHVTVREASARSQADKLVQLAPPRKQVAHVHVMAAKARLVKGRGHFALTIHALFAQDRDRRPLSLGARGRRGGVQRECGAPIRPELRAYFGLHARIIGVSDAFELLARAVGVVT
jgi:hypothetical protein